MFNIDRLLDSITHYVETKSDLVKLQVKEQIIKIITALTTAVFTLSFVFFFAFFISLSIGFYLNVLLESQYFGFAIIAGVYLLLGILVFVSKDTLISEVIYDTFFKKTMEDEPLNDEEDERT